MLAHIPQPEQLSPRLQDVSHGENVAPPILRMKGTETRMLQDIIKIIIVFRNLKDAFLQQVCFRSCQPCTLEFLICGLDGAWRKIYTGHLVTILEKQHAIMPRPAADHCDFAWRHAIRRIKKSLQWWSERTIIPRRHPLLVTTLPEFRFIYPRRNLQIHEWQCIKLVCRKELLKCLR